MSASVEAGSISIAAPARTWWFGTFGQPLLCTKTGAPLRVDRVEYHYGLEPVRAPTTTIRTADSKNGTPIISRIGRWNHFRGGPRTEPGTLSDAQGFVVRRPCQRAARSFDELLTTAKAGPRGAWITQTDVFYTAGPDHYVLTIPWNYIMCGSAIEPIDQTDFCPTRTRP